MRVYLQMVRDLQMQDASDGRFGARVNCFLCWFKGNSKILRGQSVVEVRAKLTIFDDFLKLV